MKAVQHAKKHSLNIPEFSFGIAVHCEIHVVLKRGWWSKSWVCFLCGRAM